MGVSISRAGLRANPALPLVSALFRAVGDDGLARKVRPLARRPGRVIDEDEADTDSEAGAIPEEPTEKVKES